jgi:hypothetical protein
LPTAAISGEIMRVYTNGVEVVVPSDLAQLAAFLGAAVGLAALAALVRRFARRTPGPASVVRPVARERFPVASWRGSAALATAVAAGMLFTPALVALRQIYILRGVGAPMAALLLVLLVLVAAALLAVLFADPGEDR